jgi:hypothetical protein
MGMASADALVEMFGDELRKPFKCGKCMTFWVGLATFYFFGLPIYSVFISYVMTMVIEKYIWK